MDPTGGILNYVVKKLGDLLVSEIALLGKTQRDLEWVQSELRIMQAVLEHVATTNIEDPRITAWIEDVRQLAFRAEDVVDTLSLHVSDATNKSFLPCSCCNFRIKWRHNFGTEVKQLRETVAELSRRKATYDINIPDTRSAGATDKTEELLRFRRLTAAPYVEDRDVVGLDRHVNAVKGLLVREGRRRSVVSIVGMGGLGKTTLAKKVYNDLLPSFDCTAWVDVSQKYSIEYLLRRIAREILKLSQKDEQEMNQDSITSRICGVLRSKKYLIVLDDVWTSQLWDTLNSLLPDAENGSRIIITTRKEEVARLANPKIEPYKLSTLNDEESQALFTNIVFPNEENAEQCCTGELASLREKIVKKCGGLPLAIIVAGGLLSTREKSPAEWKKVAGKIDWHQTEKGEQCMGILALSYVDLPIHLRWCFLYLGALPEDYAASTERLMLLWIAEGFIKEEDGVSMEERAERYLEELAQRCLIQVVETFLWEKLERRCRVHDLILELAVKEAKKIRFLDVWRSAHEGTPGVPMRRLSCTADVEMGITTHRPLGSNKLRTLLIMDRSDWEYGMNTYPLNIVNGEIKWSSLQRNLKLIRVLEISLYLDELTEEIGDMVNLRYLALSGKKIRKLPESLGKLRHLQTLNVGRTKVGWFPASIWQIKTLRYLQGRCHIVDSSRATRLPMPKTPLGTNVFQNMRTLRRVYVDRWMETILPYSIHLKELEILNVHRHAMSSTLKKLQKLEGLILRSSFQEKPIFNIDEIFSQTDSHTNLHSLEIQGILVVSSQPGRLPQNLTRVSLWGTESNHDVLELLGNLKYLRRLILASRSFTEDEMVFKSGWFPQLDALSLDALDIKRWVLEGRSLPLLRELNIHKCNKLEALPERLQHINALKEFIFSSGSSLGDSIRRQEGAEWDKVKHIELVRTPPPGMFEKPKPMSPINLLTRQQRCWMLPKRCESGSPAVSEESA